MEEATLLPSNSSLPLISRLDHLEFIVSFSLYPFIVSLSIKFLSAFYIDQHHFCFPLIFLLQCHAIADQIFRKETKRGKNAYAEKRSMPLDFTAKQSYFKDSLLLDRVASLEQRLFQLCLEMDSSSSSYLMSLASTQTSGESSSSQSTKTEIFYSFPTFSIPHDRDNSHTHLNTLDPLQNIRVQEKPRREEQNEKKNGSPPKEREEKNSGKRNEKKSKGGKKRSVPSSTWLHFKLLGC